MVYHILKDAEAIGKAAASVFVAQVMRKPDSVLGLATGSTPLPTYAQLARLYKEGVGDYAQVCSFNLDEYCALAPTHEQSYHYYMAQNLFRHINIAPDHARLPDGMATDLEKACADYEAAIEAAGGIDLQLLGLGVNGHIGFNEPGASFSQGTHVTALSRSTIEANQRFFASADEVPRYAVTMGVGTIMRARAILLIAVGEAKAKAVKRMIQGEPEPDCPASVLQFHPNVTVLLDAAATSLL